MKNLKIPTILGIIVLVIGIAVGVFLVQNNQVFRLRASSEIKPKNVRISNIDNDSFSVSWTTDKQVGGFITWGDTNTSLSKTSLPDKDGEFFVHSIDVDGLADQSNYYFSITSDGEEFDNNGQPWEISTGPKIDKTPNSVVASGKIVNSAGAGVANAIVYSVLGGGSTLSTTTSDDGSWLINISNTRTLDLRSFVEINMSTTLLELNVQAGIQGIATAQIYPRSANPIPDIALGEVHDFRNLPANNGDESLNTNVNVGDEEDLEVTLDSVGEGEIVNTAEPEFFGSGPAGTEITVTVESDPQTQDVQVTNDGAWSWSPPSNLEEGFHKITVSWLDADGILQTITRNFIVSAQEGPAFTATPSATPRPTSFVLPTNTPAPSPTPTIFATPTPTTRITTTTTPTTTPTKTPTPIATTSPSLPDAGVGTPTVVLVFLSLFMISSGAFLLTKSLDKKD